MQSSKSSKIKSPTVFGKPPEPNKQGSKKSVKNSNQPQYSPKTSNFHVFNTNQPPFFGNTQAVNNFSAYNPSIYSSFGNVQQPGLNPFSGNQFNSFGSNQHGFNHFEASSRGNQQPGFNTFGNNPFGVPPGGTPQPGFNTFGNNPFGVPLGGTPQPGFNSFGTQGTTFRFQSHPQFEHKPPEITVEKDDDDYKSLLLEDLNLTSDIIDDESSDESFLPEDNEMPSSSYQYPSVIPILVQEASKAKKATIKTIDSKPSKPSISKHITIQKPVVTQAPTATQKPVVTQAPTATQKPVVTQAPTATQKPVVTQAPTATQKPVVTQAPTATQKPVVTQAPTATQKPVVTQAPTATQKPVVTQAPTATQKPVVTQAPTATQKPVVTQTSTATQKPVVTQTSTSIIPDYSIVKNFEDVYTRIQYMNLINGYLRRKHTVLPSCDLIAAKTIAQTERYKMYHVKSGSFYFGCKQTKFKPQKINFFTDLTGWDNWPNLNNKPPEVIVQRILNDIVFNKETQNLLLSAGIEYLCDKCEDAEYVCYNFFTEAIDHVLTEAFLITMTLEEKESIFVQLLCTLAILHCKYGIIHSNIKLKNIALKTVNVSSDYFKYVIGDRNFYIKNTGYIPLLCNFDHAYSVHPDYSSSEYYGIRNVVVTETGLKVGWGNRAGREYQQTPLKLSKKAVFDTNNKFISLETNTTKITWADGQEGTFNKVYKQNKEKIDLKDLRKHPAEDFFRDIDALLQIFAPYERFKIGTDKNKILYGLRGLKYLFADLTAAYLFPEIGDYGLYKREYKYNF
ncbi:major outer envelope glycoprotein-like protein [Lymphocystis disease virus 2]|uniref:Major outer envelope glycoprotein-like protein n=1 Tax=Lymphocystis disease virus 2 TaxID=159183 RepID=A0A6F8X1V4_9VIRU|nr:major outer envelope glycoprotein-like protein [Lymphocystis disease virus 2]